jgi:hypothetical protein
VLDNIRLEPLSSPVLAKLSEVGSCNSGHHLTQSSKTTTLRVRVILTTMMGKDLVCISYPAK